MQPIAGPGRHWAGAALALSMFYTAQLAITALPEPEGGGFPMLLAGFGLAAAMLVVLALIQLKPGQAAEVFRGCWLVGTLGWGLVLVTLVQGGAIWWEASHALAPVGPGSLIAALPEHNRILFIVMLLALPAIAEELLYRHFVMQLFDLTRPLGRGLAVLLSTALFTASFGEYPAGACVAFMAALGLVLGAARLASGGLLAPMVLNAYAMGLGLLADALL